jgi:hypothetical protein
MSDRSENGGALIRGLAQVWPILLVAVAWGGTLVRVEILAGDVKEIRAAIRTHESRPVHPGTAVELARLRDSVTRIERLMDRMEAEERVRGRPK